MASTLDPSRHRGYEQTLIEHVQKLLTDPRFRLDTTDGSRAVAPLKPAMTLADHGIDLKRLMSQMNLPDRRLEQSMPTGQTLEATLQRKAWFFFTKTVGHLRVACVPPTRELLDQKPSHPMTAAEVQKALAALPPPLGGAPLTTILMCSAGFTLEAHEKAERSTQGVTVLIEPNDAGGWNVHGPSELKGLLDLLDPETEEMRRQRVRDFIELNSADLLSGAGLSDDRVAARLQLPVPVVENELRSYAKDNAGLATRRMDGRIVLYREGSASPHADAGGLNMPFWERVKNIFRRSESDESKIARLAAERAGLNQQRERAYGDIATVEKKEGELAGGFATATALAQRRIATEISQLRKEQSRRQQLLDALDKKINIVTSAIHSLELKKEVDPEKLRRFENLVGDSEELDEGLATLQQMDEEANSMVVGPSEIPDDVASIMAELQSKAAPDATAQTPLGAGVQKTSAGTGPAAAVTPPAIPTAQRRPDRGQAEPG